MCHFIVPFSCVPANSIGRQRRAVDKDANVQADYEVAMDPSPPNAEPRNISSLTESVETANTKVAEAGVELNGTIVKGRARQVAIVTGMSFIFNFLIIFGALFMLLHSNRAFKHVFKCFSA